MRHHRTTHTKLADYTKILAEMIESAETLEQLKYAEESYSRLCNQGSWYDKNIEQALIRKRELLTAPKPLITSRAARLAELGE